MNYRISISDAKKTLLNEFVILEYKYKTQRNESRWISLHCKFDTNTKNFWEKEMIIYLQCEEETEEIIKYVSKWGFEKIQDIPDELVFLIGNYNGTIKCFDSVFVF